MALQISCNQHIQKVQWTHCTGFDCKAPIQFKFSVSVEYYGLYSLFTRREPAVVDPGQCPFFPFLGCCAVTACWRAAVAFSSVTSRCFCSGHRLIQAPWADKRPESALMPQITTIPYEPTGSGTGVPRPQRTLPGRRQPRTDPGGRAPRRKSSPRTGGTTDSPSSAMQKEPRCAGYASKGRNRYTTTLMIHEEWAESFNHTKKFWLY